MIGSLAEVTPVKGSCLRRCERNRKALLNTAKMINWKALDNVPLLFYILALKTLVLCLGFAAVKMYQSRKVDKLLKQQQAEKKQLAQQTQALIDKKKED